MDELSGEPQAGIEVRIGVPGAVRALARTDSMGRFEASFTSEAQLFDVLVEASESYLPCRLQRTQPGNQVQISLTPRVCAIGGQVLDGASGKPVPYAWVNASDGDAYAARAQADGAGMYRLPVDIWQSAAPVSENHLRARLGITVEHRDYLPLEVHGVDLERYAYSPSPAPLDLASEPYCQEVTIEAYLSGTRNAAEGAAFVYGSGPRVLGRSVTDALGRARALVPAWRYRDRPVESNEPLDNAWVGHLGQQFQPVQASGIRASRPIGTAPGDGARTPAIVRFSLAPLDSTTMRSSYLMAPVAGPTETGPAPEEPGEVSKPVRPGKPDAVI